LQLNRQRIFHQQEQHALAESPETATTADVNNVSITSSRHGGVTLSPVSSSASSDPFTSLDGRVGRFGRAESADRFLHHRRTDGGGQTAKKKISAPALGEAANRLRDDLYNGNTASLDESFRKIFARADNSLSQAESILSSLRADDDVTSATAKGLGQHAKKASPIGGDCSSEGSSEPASLGSDIETNIKRLEKTQAKINAALETFRNVQAMNVDLRGDDHPYHGHHRHHRHHRAFVLNGQDLTGFSSLPPNTIPPPARQHERCIPFPPEPMREEEEAESLTKSRTAPGHIGEERNEGVEETSGESTNPHVRLHFDDSSVIPLESVKA